MAIYTDNFNRANDVINAFNYSWVAISGRSIPAITGNLVGMNAVVGALYNQRFDNDQYSQATLSGLNQGFTSRNAYLFVRGNSSDQEKYELNIYSTDNGDTGYDVTISINYVNAAGAVTLLNSVGPIVDAGGNGTWKIAVTGSSINVYRDTVFQVGATDSTITSGKPGFYAVAGGAGPTLDNFEAADILTGPQGLILVEDYLSEATVLNNYITSSATFGGNAGDILIVAQCIDTDITGSTMVWSGSTPSNASDFGIVTSADNPINSAVVIYASVFSGSVAPTKIISSLVAAGTRQEIKARRYSGVKIGSTISESFGAVTSAFGTTSAQQAIFINSTTVGSLLNFVSVDWQQGPSVTAISGSTVVWQNRLGDTDTNCWVERDDLTTSSQPTFIGVNQNSPRFSMVAFELLPASQVAGSGPNFIIYNSATLAAAGLTTYGSMMLYATPDGAQRLPQTINYLDANAVAYWSLSQNAPETGTFTGVSWAQRLSQISFVAGHVGNAAQWNNSGDAIQGLSISASDPAVSPIFSDSTSDFTVDFWRYRPATLATSDVFAWYAEIGGKGIVISANTSPRTFFIRNNNQTTIEDVSFTTHEEPVDTWSHYAFVFNKADQQISMYYSGSLVETKQMTNVFPSASVWGNNNGRIVIGAWNNVTVGTRIDELRISNVARSAAEIAFAASR
jgi:hypothetical protein